MKKLISLCTAAVLCLSLLSACGAPNQGDAPSDTPSDTPAVKDANLADFAAAVQENHEFAALEKADPADEELGRSSQRLRRL